jgi:hypothetical protein
MSSTVTLEIDMYETLIELLRTNISDPIGRGDQEWIAAGFPEDEYTKPAISVLEVAQTYDKPRGHGNKGTIEGYRFQIDIYSSRRTTATISTVEYSGLRLLSYLSGAVKDVLRLEGKVYFHNNLGHKFIDLTVVMANTPPYAEGPDEYRKTLGVIIEVERPKT